MREHMSQVLQNVKKGDILFEEGEKIQNLFLIQSGLVSVFLHRNKKNIEVYQASSNHMLGEAAIFGASTYQFSAVALNDTKIVAIPIEVFKNQMSLSTQLVQILMKSMFEKQKNSINEVKAIRLERDAGPCPLENISKVFGVIYHVVKHIGKAKGTAINVNWTGFRQYAQRVFLENPTRLENACNILVKLKFAEYEMAKNETSPILEIGSFTVNDIKVIESFFEYFQHHYYKSANPSFFQIDEKLTNFVQNLLSVTEKQKINPQGVVTAKYSETMEALKALPGKFTTDQFDRLEAKGLFVKRESSSSGGTLQFYRADFEAMLKHWKILREIEKWNEKGMVDLKEAPPATAQASSSACPSCKAAISGTPKFCPDCGQKLAGAQAA